MYHITTFCLPQLVITRPLIMQRPLSSATSSPYNITCTYSTFVFSPQPFVSIPTDSNSGSLVNQTPQFDTYSCSSSKTPICKEAKIYYPNHTITHYRYKKKHNDYICQRISMLLLLFLLLLILYPVLITLNCIIVKCIA